MRKILSAVLILLVASVVSAAEEEERGPFEFGRQPMLELQEDADTNKGILYDPLFKMKFSYPSILRDAVNLHVLNCRSRGIVAGTLLRLLRTRCADCDAETLVSRYRTEFKAATGETASDQHIAVASLFAPVTVVAHSESPELSPLTWGKNETLTCWLGVMSPQEQQPSFPAREKQHVFSL